MFWAVAIALALVVALVSGVRAAESGGRVNVNVECHCPDVVGTKFCSAFKEKVRQSAGYQLAEDTNGYGLGVHFSCIDLWQGLTNQLSGRMAAVSVAFTIYSDQLPGEVFEDSSVFRVGKDATGEMSNKIVSALGQLVSSNASLFERLRSGSQSSPAPESSPAP